MSIMKDHIAKEHLANASHAVTMAKEHQNESKRHFALAKEFADTDQGAADEHSAQGEHHDRVAKAWTTYGEHHTACAKSLGIGKAEESTLEKAAGDNIAIDPESLSQIIQKAINEALGNKLVPDNVRGVIPSNVPNRAVPRTGQPEIVNMRDVPAELQDFVKVEF